MNEMLFEQSIIRRCQQSLLGYLFLFITPLSIIPGIPFDADNPVGWWHSVSESYYSNTGIVMISAFIIIGLIGISFRGRNIAEKIFMFLMGISSIGIVMFPHAYMILERTGFFFVNGEKSIFIHFVFAGIFFFSLSVLCFLFSIIPEETSKKHQRNVLYLSSWVICTIASFIILLSKIVFFPPWTTLVMEFIMFSLFGTCLLVVSGKISLLK